MRTVLSGPSTGVVGAQAVGRLAGYHDMITFDMGGTSTDVALLHGGACRMASEAVVHGYPIKAPMLDIHTVGAGGGSIAYVDSGGLLKVGPRSAGADPGPVCYGRGNMEPTVTDANVVLQTLNPRILLGGRMPVRQDLARAAIARLAAELGMDVMATAQGIISVVTANMARAIRVISVQRGHDPRDYTLVAFGGAGPLHAARLAKRTGHRPHPGAAQSRHPVRDGPAADRPARRFRNDAAAHAGRPPRCRTSVRRFRALAAQADAWFDRGGHRRRRRAGSPARWTCAMPGQNYELSIAAAGWADRRASLDGLAEGFAAAHQRMYGFVADDDPVQLVTFRVEAAGIVPKATFSRSGRRPRRVGRHHWRAAYVWLPEAGGFVACPVYDRERLRAGNRIAGPAIVEQMDATTVVLPGMVAWVEPYP